MSVMDESHYQHLADGVFRRLEDGLKDADPDVVDCERAGDVVTLTFNGTRRCIVNTQRPVRQIWLAAGAKAWHFSYEEATGRWLDDKGHGIELFAQVAAIVKEQVGLAVTFG
jgi:CyaY protein